MSINDALNDESRQSKIVTLPRRKPRAVGSFGVVHFINRLNRLPLKNASELAVMVALAKFANPEGVCWPSLKTIASYAHMSRRGVMHALNRLERAGLVERTRRRRPGKRVAESTLYRIEQYPARRCNECESDLPKGLEICPLCGARD